MKIKLTSNNRDNFVFENKTLSYGKSITFEYHEIIKYEKFINDVFNGKIENITAEILHFDFTSGSTIDGVIEELKNDLSNVIESISKIDKLENDLSNITESISKIDVLENEILPQTP